MPTIANSNEATKDEIRALMQGLSRDTSNPANSQYIEWDTNSSTDPNRGSHLIGSFEGAGGNTVLTVTTQPTNVTGVLVAYASSNSTPGAGTLTFTSAAQELTWAESGDSAGAAVDVTAGGWFTLTSANTHTIRIIVVAASLPVGNTSDTNVTISSGVASNPVIGMCYNRFTNGTIRNSSDPYSSCWNIEGNYHDGTRMTIEAYLEFADYSGSTFGAARRPFFSKFNKETNFIQRTDIVGGAASGTETGIFFGMDSGVASSTPIARLMDNEFYIYAPTDADSYFYINSFAGRQSVFLFSADGDNLSTKPTVKFITSFAGASDQHRTFSLIMSDDTAAKTGVAAFRADSDLTAGDSIMFSVGLSTTSNSALVHFSSVNAPISIPTTKLTAKTGQTSPILELVSCFLLPVLYVPICFLPR